MRHIYHRPGYTPEAAAARRFVTLLARACRVPPRKFRKERPPVAWSSAEHALRFLEEEQRARREWMREQVYQAVMAACIRMPEDGGL